MPPEEEKRVEKKKNPQGEMRDTRKIQVSGSDSPSPAAARQTKHLRVNEKPNKEEIFKAKKKKPNIIFSSDSDKPTQAAGDEKNKFHPKAESSASEPE